MKLLIGKTAIITGATRGIGKAIAETFASNGANVAFTYASSEEKAKAIEADLIGMGVKAKAYKSDAADMDAAQELVKEVLADFNEEKLGAYNWDEFAVSTGTPENDRAISASAFREEALFYRNVDFMEYMKENLDLKIEEEFHGGIY